MNKKVIAMAITAAMVAPLAAQAGEVKMSGRVNVQVVSVDTGVAATSGVAPMSDSGQGRLQFDVTDGSWFGRVGLDARVTNGATTLTGRDYYVGTSVGPGKLMLGRMAGAVANLESDPYIATFLQMRGAVATGTQYGSSSFVNNVLGYTMKAGDININAQFNPGAVGTGVTDAGHFGLGVSGKAGSIGYYFGTNNGNPNALLGATGAVTKFGLNMDVAGMNVFFGSDSETTATGVTTDRMSYGVRMDMAGGKLDVTLGDNGAAANNGYTRVAFAKGQWYAGYVANGTTSAMGFGATVKF